MLGQGVVVPGPAKITFGTGGMLDVVVGSRAARRSTPAAAGGTFPIVAWRRDGQATWGLEAIMLSAGTNVEWLRDDLGILATSAESHDVAAQCDDHRRRGLRARRCSGWAPRSGTTAPGARCWA